MTVSIAPLDPASIKASELALATDATQAATLVITSPEMYAVVGQILIAKLREKDAAQEFADRYTKPAYRNWQDLLALFKPTKIAYEKIELALKGAIRSWEFAQAQEKEQARTDARAALATGDVPAMTEALSIANAPEARAEGVGTRFVWKVKRYVLDLMRPEDMIPNEAKINAIARAHRGEDPPVVPGVVFEKDVIVSGKR